MMKDLRFTRAETAMLAAAAVLLLLPPLLLENTGYYLRIAVLILMYAGMAGSWNLISGFANQISLGHAAFFGVGAYTSTLLLIHFGLSPWLGMLAAGAVGALTSFVIGIPTFRLRGHYYALATIAFVELMRILALYFRDLTGGPVGLTVPFVGESFRAFQFYGNRTYYFVALAMLAGTILVTYLVARGPLGYRLRALKNSHDAAETVGIDTFRAKLTANALSGTIMAMYGTFYAQFQYFIDPDTVFGFWTISITVAMMAILGGLGYVWGPFLGAAILVPLDELANIVFTGEAAAVGQLLYGLLLIALILWRPHGLLSWLTPLVSPRRRERRGARLRETLS